MRMVAATLFAVALVSALASAPGARAEDNGDLVFWQSIQNSTNPAEYQAYLDAFPNGRFRALALLRLKNPPTTAPAAAPAMAAPPVPAPAPPQGIAAGQPNIVGDGSNKIIVQPATARVGQKFKVSFANFPDPNADMFLVVPAGTPDFNPTNPPADLRPIYSYRFWNRSSLVDLQIGPFAPGNYEARYMTTLYNNEQPPRYETSARTMFSVR